MRRKLRNILCMMLVACALLGCTAQAAAVSTEPAGTVRASYYLSGYSAGLKALGSKEMKVTFSVYGVDTMDKIGADKIVIEYWTGSDWLVDHTARGSAHPEFYVEDELFHKGSYTFVGIPGIKYRATVTAYAGRNGGSDTREITSQEVVCVA